MAVNEPGQDFDGLKPPVASIGIIGWIRSNLFNTWYNSILTLVVFYLLYKVVPPFIGWALINATRERLQTVNGEFDLKDFHDKLLSAGSIALPFVIRSRFGQPLWESVRKQVFRV